jgi:hypothetical protein
MNIAPCRLAQRMLPGLDAAAGQNSLEKYSNPEFRVAALPWLRGRDFKLGHGIGIGIGGVGQVGKIAVGDGAQFGADYVRGEARSEQAAIERGELAVVEPAADVREAAFDAGADEQCFIRFGEDGIERGLDELVGDAAPAQLAGNAKASAMRAHAAAREIECVALIVEIVKLAEPGDDGGDEVLIFSALLQVSAHIVQRIGAARQRTLRGEVQLMLSRELARCGAGAHRGI